MKHLPKHLRPRWRYLVVGLESWPDADLSRGPFQREVWYAAQNLLGDPGSADADLTVVRFRFEAGRGAAIVRARRGEVERARAALACIDAVDGHPVGVRVRGVSGTIRAGEESYLGGAGGFVDESTVELTADGASGPGRRRRDGAVDVTTPSGYVGATDADTSRPGLSDPDDDAAPDDH
ncbi:Rpp14/Pop5 family protein [Halobaculum magnesiiphilum]|uniref:Ribonuclease P protein component 2 n=1 Tax=Halobaculum magnesiiphilum TaxID=1017351 RepID=A0A8T8WD32_9EURY|nr:Rpp14/Pop5 family protein [Halobaculum magnesiiphilum]QZP37673.1 ribonuclease P [Halobaculum magnesiiphilum]